jgi:hypothetical protein
MTMRTVEEINARLVKIDSDDRDQDTAHQVGMNNGFVRAIQLIQDGKTTAEILEKAQASERNYTPYGDDYEDAYQSGYVLALYWCVEQLDWDADGNPIYRPGNIWGLGNDLPEPEPPVYASQEEWDADHATYDPLPYSDDDGPTTEDMGF